MENVFFQGIYENGEIRMGHFIPATKMPELAVEKYNSEEVGLTIRIKANPVIFISKEYDEEYHAKLKDIYLNSIKDKDIDETVLQYVKIKWTEIVEYYFKKGVLLVDDVNYWEKK